LAFCRLLLATLTVFGATLGHAQSGPALYSAPTAVDRFLASHPGATQVSAQKDGAVYKTSKGLILVAAPGSTYQDDSGKWKVVAPQIASDNAGGWLQNGSAVKVAIVGGGSTKHLKIGNGPDAWDLTLPNAAYVNQNNFTFQTGGQTWRLRVLPQGTQMETTVASKTGKRTTLSGTRREGRVSRWTRRATCWLGRN
jgi:hypothetical protein